MAFVSIPRRGRTPHPEAESSTGAAGLFLASDGASIVVERSTDVQICLLSGLVGREHGSEATLSLAEVGNGVSKILGAEIRPQRIDEQELGVGAFPKKEVAQSLLATSADQEIDVGSR